MSLGVNKVKEQIGHGDTSLGIELDSTRIKAVLIGEDHTPIAPGGHDQESRYVDHIQTYTLDDIWNDVRGCYDRTAEDVKKTYGITLTAIGSIGFSTMMRGYMAFNKEGELLVPFRTWKNTIIGPTTGRLIEVFRYNTSQRWSIAYLYQAALNKEEHVKGVDYPATLRGYVYQKLTGRRVLGISDAAGIFPAGIHAKDFDQRCAEQFDQLVVGESFPWRLRDILPKVPVAGEDVDVLTEEGARLLGASGSLKVGIPICPPEGDTGIGMAATNSVAVRTGNVSTGTNAFVMVVLGKELEHVYPEISLVTMPTDDTVAMVHCNNCTSDPNAWVSLFKEFLEAMGMKADMNQLFGTFYSKAPGGDSDRNDLLAYSYLSEEHIAHSGEGRPLFMRTLDSRLGLANFMRVHLYTSLGVFKIGMDVLLKKERVKMDSILDHGGLFKTKSVDQRILAGAMNAPVSVMETAREGDVWGIALLISHMRCGGEDEALGTYLAHKVLAGDKGTRMEPVEEDVEGFETFTKRYVGGLAIEKAAMEHMKD